MPALKMFFGMYTQPHRKMKEKVMKRLYTLVIFTVIFSSWLNVANAQNVDFPDAELEFVVRGTLGIPPDSPITIEDMQRLRALRAIGFAISDLTGLEHATQLVVLDLRISQINNLSPLAELTQLKSLLLSENQISNISPLADLTQLEQLALWTNQIQDLSPLRRLTQLNRLSLANNKITDVSPLAGLTQLKWLDIRDNQIRDVSPLSGLVNLEDLSLAGNPITDTSPLAGLTKLVKVDVEIIAPGLIPDRNLAAAVRSALGLGRNATITKQTMQRLTSLDAANRQIKNLTGLEHATQLTELYLHQNQIRDISPLAGLTQLRLLTLYLNQIRDVSPLAELTQLVAVEIGGNQISDVSPLAGLTQLRALSVSENQISDVSPLAELTQLWVLGLWDNQISDVSPLVGLTQLEVLYLRDNRISDVSPLAGLIQLKELYLQQNNISDVSPLAGLVNLEKLGLTGNPITDTSPLVSLAKLVKVDVEITPPEPVTEDPEEVEEPISVEPITKEPEEPISVEPTPKVEFPDTNLAAAVREALNLPADADIPKAQLATLTYLGASVSHDAADADKISNLTGLEHATDLTWLELRGNEISDISPLSGLTQLTWLGLRGNEISDISPLSGLTQLTWLGLRGNEISDISPLIGLTQLIGLDLGSNQISGISPLSGLTKLTELYLDFNEISDISALSGLTQLTDLSLWNNQISDISPLSGLTQLTNLDIDDNEISDISPLARLTSLTTLWIQDNEISDISPLSGLTQLTELYLDSNEISDISVLSNLTQLKGSEEWHGLYLEDNPLSYASINTHIPALQANGVNVRFDNVAHPALLKILGDDQTAEAGTTLTTPFVVEIVNELGNPMRGMVVTFTVTRGGGTLSATTVTTNAIGRARTTLTLGLTPGRNTVTATATGIQSSAIFTANAGVPPIYWVDKENGTLHRSTGTTTENLVPSVRNATSVAVDVASGKVYWTQQTGERTGKIQRANLDGSNVQLVKNLTSAPRGIAIDAVNNKLYLTNSWGKVQRMNFNGSGFQPNLITGLTSPTSLVLDVAGGKIYWIQQTGERTGKIQRANLNGADLQLVKNLTSVPRDIAIDTVNNELYLTNSWGKVQRMNFNGSGFQPNFITGRDSPTGIAVDIAGGKIYWAENDSISCADLNGGNIQTVVSGLNSPSDIALGISASMNPAAPANVSLTSDETVIPEEARLLANYPNPFNPETWIPYHLAKDADVTLHIYAVNGTLVRTLAIGHQDAGRYQSRSRAAHWDGKNEFGESVASGVYFYTLTAGDFSATRKMLIMK